MKKHFLQWLGLGLLLLMLPVTIQAQSLKTTIFVDESFEKGMPSDWTQEYSTDGGATWTTVKPDGGLSWATESGDNLHYPNVAYGAGKSRAYLRNETGQTVGARVRLITPVMNILKDEEGRLYYQPILRFAHAQDKWTADFDTLRVYYRAGAKQAWVPIVQYLKPNANWEWVEIDLPMPSETYQIAFDASENLGRGIVLDSVMVRTKPQCTVPSDLFTSEMANNGVTINWNASEDAEGFCVLMIDAKERVDVNLFDKREDIPNDIIVHIDTTKNGRTFTMRYENMQEGANMNVWVRSICDGENSAWSTPLNVHMPSTKQIPYVETFNIPRQGTTLNLGKCRIDTWQYGGTWAPYTSAWMQKSSQEKYSPDGSDALLFIGGTIKDGVKTYTEGKAIPVGSNAFVVSPEIADAKGNTPLKDMQVSFWMTLYHSATKNNARGIIVGVMTDKNDITTFVPVDTCTMWACNTFEEFIVPLDKYEGNGHFIAFLSKFDKPNMVAIDSVTICKRPAIGKVTQVHANAQDTCATITWKAVQGASKYEVLIADSLASKELRYKSAEAIAQLEEQNKIVTASVTANSFTTNKLKPSLWDGRNYYRGLYYVYVRAEGGEWSNITEFVTAAQHNQLPMNFTFEQDFGYYAIGEDKNILYPAKVNVYSNDPEYPHIVQDMNHTNKGNSSLYMVMDAGCDTWITFPAIEDIQKAQISFYMTAKTTANAEKSRVVVGVMTDPSDINTFTEVSVFNGFKDWAKCQAIFSQYKGTGKYIAIRWQEPEGQSSSVAWIDDVIISEAGKCAVPFALSATNNGKTGTFTWQGNADTYNIKIGTSILSDDDLKNNKKANMVNETVSGNTYTLENLQPGKIYYFYVQAICDGTATEWSSAGVLKTECFAGPVTLPYKQDFEGQGTGSGVRPNCWLCAPANDRYPNLATNYNHTEGGDVSLNLYSTTAIGSYIAMPEFEGNIQDIKLSFWMTGSYPQYELFVGVMTDPLDYTTFEKVATLHPTVGNSLEQKFVGFEDYKGTGRYIAFSTINGKSNGIFLDDVEVSSIACAIPFNFRTTASTDTTLTATWEGRAEEWEVLVASRNIPTTQADIDDGVWTLYPDTLSKYQASNDVLYYQARQTSQTFSLKDLKPNTSYYVYVRPLCGDSLWGTGRVRTRCVRLNPNVAQIYGFEEKEIMPGKKGGDSHGSYWTINADNILLPECWSSGAVQVTDQGLDMNNPYLSYYPFAYKMPHTGEKAMKVGYEQRGRDNWLASPELAINDISQLVVNFWAKASKAETHINVGIMLDPDDYSTIEPIASFSAENTDYTQYEVVFENYSGPARYVVFYGDTAQAGSVTSYYFYYLDDIEFSTATCPSPKLSLNNLTTNSVRVSSGLKVNGAQFNEWRTLITTYEIELDSLKSDLYMKNLTDNGKDSIIFMDTLITSRARAIQVNNLAPDSTYYVAVATKCDEEYKWKTTYFSTLCGDLDYKGMNPISFEEEEGFDYGMGKKVKCWTVGLQTAPQSAKAADKAQYTPYVIQRALLSHTGTKALRFNTTTSYKGAYAISPALTTPDIRKMQMRFYAKANSTSLTTDEYKSTQGNTLIVGIMTDPVDFSTFIPVDTILAVDGEWVQYTTRFDKYRGRENSGTIEYGRHVAFYSNASVANVMYVDDIIFEDIPECANPIKVKVVDVEQEAAFISWQSSSYENRIRIFRTAVPDSLVGTYKKCVIDTLVRGQNARIVGLQPATRYYVYVGANCGVTPWSTEHCTFKTACAQLEITKETPYFEDFDSYTDGAGNHADCWETFYQGKVGSEAMYPCVRAAAKYGTKGNGYILWNVAAQAAPELRATAALPQLPQDVQGMSLSFMYKYAGSAATPAKILVGIASDVSSIEKLIETQVIVDTIQTLEKDNKTWTKYELPLGNLNAGGKHILLMLYYESGVSTTDAHIDNVRIGYAEGGDGERVPEEPKFLTVSNESFTTAQVKITPADSIEANYQLALLDEKQAGYILELADLMDYATIIDADTLYLLDNLQENSKYMLYARSVVGDNKSVWMGPTTFFTRKSKIGAEESMRWGFEYSEGLALIPNSSKRIPNTLYTGNVSSSGTGNYPNSVTNTEKLAYAMKGDYALEMKSIAAADSAYIALPIIDNASAKQLSLNIRAGHTAIGYDRKGIGYDTITTSHLAARLYVGTVDTENDIASFSPILYFRPSELQMGDRPTKANNYLFDHIVVPLPDLTGKRLAVLMPAIATLYMDEMAIEPKIGYTTPSMPAIVAADETATMVWDKRGNTKWNVYVYNYKCDFLTACKDSLVFSAENVTDTTITITGLKENTRYYAFVQVAGYQNALGTFSPRATFATICHAMEYPVGGLTYSFERKDGWEFQYPLSAENTIDSLVYKPECWIVGNKSLDGEPKASDKPYIPHIKTSPYDPVKFAALTQDNLNKYTYNYALEDANKGTSAFLFWGGLKTAAYHGAYAIMPLINAQLDTLQVEFYGRCAYAGYSSTNMKDKFYTSATSGGLTYTQATYSHTLTIGTVTNPADISTFEPLDVVEYTMTGDELKDKMVNTDSHKYYEKFIVPLQDAKGRHIAFMQEDGGFFLMDSLVVVPRRGFLNPKNLSTEPDVYEATLSWKVWQKTDTTLLVVSTTADMSTILLRDTLVNGEMSYKLNGLKPNTRYYFSVQQVRGEEKTEAIVSDFWTNCLSIDKPMAKHYGFNEGNVQIQGAKDAAYVQTECWTYGNAGSNQTSWSKTCGATQPFNMVDNVSTQYSTSRQGMDDYALFLYAASGATPEKPSTYLGYAVMPAVSSVDMLDTLQLDFYMNVYRYYNTKATTANQGKYGSSSYRTDNYAHAVIVGTCEDPSNPFGGNWQALDTCYYSDKRTITYASSKTTDATKDNDYGYIPFSVSLRGAKYPYIFMSSYGKLSPALKGTNKACYTLIDDVSFSRLKECKTTTGLKAVDILDKSAVLIWNNNGSESYSVRYSTDATFKTNVEELNTTDTTWAISGLTGETVYYWSVKSDCGNAGESEWTAVESFKTAFLLPFFEDFTNDDIIGGGKGWQQKSGFAYNVFEDVSSLVDPATQTNSYYRWTFLNSDKGLKKGHYYVAMHSSTNTTYCRWLISPVISLETSAAYDLVYLTFDVALTKAGSADAANTNNYDDQFMVIISDDAGKTWKKENAVKWNNETSDTPDNPDLYFYGKGDYVLNEISHTGQSVILPLDHKYMGKNIKVAFYSESQIKNAYNDIHIDNVRLNYCITKNEQREACQYVDIDEVFDGTFPRTNGDSVAAGREMFTKYAEAKYEVGKQIPDTLYSYERNILAAPMYVYSVELCDGQTYKGNNFAPRSKAGVYRQKLQSIVTGCDSIVELHLSFRPKFNVSAEETICEGDFFEFGGKRYYEDGTYPYTFTSVGGCDSTVTLRLHVAKPDTTEIQGAICAGERYTLGGFDTDQPGINYLTLRGQSGCDSVIALNLTVYDSIITTINQSIKRGLVYKFGKNNLKETGTYREVYKATSTQAAKCDSIVILNLLVIEPTPVYDAPASFCEGRFLDWNDMVIRTAGEYKKTLRASDGADSIAAIVVTVNQPTYSTIDTTICYGESVIIGKQTFYATASEKIYLENQYGCDSVVTLNLAVRPEDKRTFTATILHGESYEWAGQVLYESTTLDTTFVNTFGCDSIITLNLVVKSPDVEYIDTTICRGDVISFGKYIHITDAGVYYDTIHTEGQADIIKGLVVSLNEPKQTVMSATICEGENYKFNDTTLYKEGMYRETLVASNGCDSVVILTLNVTKPKYISLVETVCHGSSYQFGTKGVIGESGTYRDTLPASNGCDSIVTLVLTVSDYLRRDTMVTICEGESFKFANQDLVNNGTYRDTTKTADGCDSITTLTLNVNRSQRISKPVSICEGDYYVFADTILTTTGIYRKTFVSVNGCDSIVTITLSVLKPVVYHTSMDICEGDSVLVNSRYVSQPGIYRDTLIGGAATGCDSIVSFTLRVNKPSTYAYSRTICHGNYYEFGAHRLTEAGVYMDTLVNAAKCDSIVTLTLNVTAPLQGIKFVEMCEGGSYSFNGKTYTEPGVYVDTIQNEFYCDSILTIHLTTATTIHDTIRATICSGKVYDKFGFYVDKPGTYSMTSHSVAGCDSITVLELSIADNVLPLQASICPGDTYEFFGQSLTAAGTYTETRKGQGEECDTTITLTLTVLSGDTLFVKDTITTDELPYLYNGEVILPLETPEGVHTDTVEVKSESGACSRIVILTITVRQPDAVDNVGYTGLVIRPNVVRRNEIVTIGNDFSPSERAEMTVEMFDMLGHRMDVRIPETGAITIGNFPSAGIYTVRISTGEQTFIGRIVVKN